MTVIITATGKEIECDAVIAATMYPVLHIHTHSITGAEAWEIFSNPEETKVLKKYEDGKGAGVYKGYTTLQSVQRSPFIDGDILIWLNLNLSPELMQ